MCTFKAKGNWIEIRRQPKHEACRETSSKKKHYTCLSNKWPPNCESQNGRCIVSSVFNFVSNKYLPKLYHLVSTFKKIVPQITNCFLLII